MTTTTALVERLAAALRQRRLMLATAESCTGGMIAAACTSLAGSSEWFERGFVTYSNAAKRELLGVEDALIVAHGAVSAEVAQAMAAGALLHSRTHVAVAVTGIAGPGGGSADKPVGTVWLAVASVGEAAEAVLLRAKGHRESIRDQSVRKAIELLLDRLARAAPV